MTQDQLAKAVSIKANNEVQTKIRDFERAIAKAVESIGLHWNASWHKNTISPDSAAAKCLIALIAGDKARVFPSDIWRKAEERIMDEILSTMNCLQQTLLAKDVPVENPAEPDIGESK